jgi:phosphopantothenoylcysteine decarboxylase/phosphopantothenate--cysteine ligase
VAAAPLAGRRIVVGVCGGIAAYKAVEVCRRLVEAGAYVVPVMTRNATRFVGEATFSALASEPARTSLWDDADPVPHIHLGQTAELIVVVPATARVLGSYAAGIASDLLTATLLATRAPVLVCPAMHTEMWEHPAIVEVLARLREWGVGVVGPEVGPLAGGDVGAGRLASPETIVAAVEDAVRARDEGRFPRQEGGDLSGLCVLVTAGGTREPIDAVRYLGNRSSGKQGHAIADEAAARGARVVLVTTVDRPAGPGVERVRVETAADMERAVLERSDRADVVVMAAAVADFRPKVISVGKVRKDEGIPELVLEPTTDILAVLGQRRRPGQTLVGFAAETEAGAATGGGSGGGQMQERAAQKRAQKGVDLIVANDVSAAGVGFEHDTNAVLLVGPEGFERPSGVMSKREVARWMLDAVVDLRRRTTGESGSGAERPAQVRQEETPGLQGACQ